MKKPGLELRLKERRLSIGRAALELDDALISAGISNILNRKEEIALELRYRPGAQKVLEADAENIYLFLEENLAREIEVSTSPNENYPAIALTGDFTAIVRS